MSDERVIRWHPLDGPALELGRAVLAIGVFDGLHLGHRALLSDALECARAQNAQLVTVSFKRDPDEVFKAASGGMAKLLSNERRLDLLAEFTGSGVLALPVDSSVFAMEPRAFLDALGSVCEPVAFHVGADFRFGAAARGTVADIDAWCAQHACSCHPHDLVECDGAPVTATRIRGLLAQGEVASARELLAGRAHSVHGTVVHGRGQGAGFGFATANVDPDAAPMLPAEGVYAAYAIVDGQPYAAAVNVGLPRSFADATAVLEAHLLDFDGDLYGKQMDIDFVEWLRESRVFKDNDELIATVTSNINWVRDHLGGDACAAYRR